MAYKKTNWTNTTPINTENLNKIENGIYNIYNDIFPVGRGFIDFTNTDFSNYLGFTWERTLVGMTPVGIDSNDVDFNTIGKTGGAKTHKLTVAQMPKHKHILFAATGGTIDFDAYTSKDNGSNGDTANTGWGTETSASGGSQPHNNLQPYQVVAYWKRVA